MHDRCRRMRWGSWRLAFWSGIAAVLLGTAGWVGPDAEARFAVGQRWRYQHEGPRPGSVEPNAVDGERILRVLSTAPEQGKVRWVIEERFTKDEGVIGRLYVDQDGLITAVEVENQKGEVARLRYDPPVPYGPADMNVAAGSTTETTLRTHAARFALPSKTVTERLADETISTPAGEFPGCSHFKSTTTSTVDIKIAKLPITEERERWYHSSVHGMVKEVYRKGPIRFLGWSRPGYTATSVLTAYDKETPPLPGRTRTPTSIAGDGHQKPNRSPPGRVAGRWKRPILMAGAVTTTLVLVLGRRIGRRRVSS